MKKVVILLILLVIIVLSVVFSFKTLKAPSIKLSDLSARQKSIIAHAGGSLNIDGTRYTYLNSYNAIKNSYDQGVRLCEIDFLYTVDEKPVAFHSWDGFLTKFFNVESKEDYTHDEFMNFKMIGNDRQLDLDSIINLMENEFTDLFLVTDTKDDNTRLLYDISHNYPKILDRVIPQVYTQDQYYKAKAFGFKNIIYTLYQNQDTDEEVIDFCKENTVFAITMPIARVNREFTSKLQQLNVYTYTHTINTVEEFDEMKELLIDGVYSDDLKAN